MKKLIPHFFRFLSALSPQLAAILALKLFTHPRRKPRSKEEMDFLTTGNQITFNSGRKAHTWGKGPAIWLIHGWESRGSTFYKLIPSLINNGFQAIAWDGPAHGASPGFSNTVPNNAQCLADDINEKRLPKPFAFVGHSFGGATMGVLSKIYTMPPKVVLASAPTRLMPVFTGFAQLIRLNKKATDQFIVMANAKSPFKIEACSLVNNDFSNLSSVLVIHDEKDEVIDFSDFIALKNAWQSGQFIITENLGHRMTIKDPIMTKLITDFISTHESTD